MTKRMKSIFTVLVIIIFMTAMTSCSNSNPDKAVELSDVEMESLMEQVAESDVDTLYKDYLKDEAFAVAEVFGVTKDGDQGTAYAYLNEGDYVVLKGKAYNMSGSAGEVIIKFSYTDSGITLTEVVWSADGDLHEDWLKENYPAEFLRKANAYQPYDLIGRSKLGAKLREKVKISLGVPVDTDNFLEIDTDKGTYTITKITDNGNGTIDTEIIEQGSLSDSLNYSSIIKGNIKTYYQTTDGTWSCDGYTYQYRLEIKGRLNNAVQDSEYVYLSNIPEITFEQAWKASGLSSDSNDYFQIQDAVLVEMN